jgi:GR25 family glycosyltransferase involved in LPS biosynthesis
MDVFYINLARRPDRRKQFLMMNRGIARFHWAEAVDGKTLDVRQLIQKGIVRRTLKTYTRGALGCALSHKRIWERCASGRLPITVAEDDGAFNRCFSKKAPIVMKRLPRDWDIVLWGWNFDSVLHVELAKGIPTSVMYFDAANGKPVTDFRTLKFEVVPLRLINAFGTVCYSLTPSGAQKLDAACFPLRSEWLWVEGLRRNVCNSGIDVMMNKHYRDLHAYVAFPPLVWTDNDKTTSDIAGKVS